MKRNGQNRTDGSILMPVNKAEQTYTEWEREITNHFIEMYNISNGDAQGVVEAESFYMRQCWSNGLSAKDSAIYIDLKRNPK